MAFIVASIIGAAGAVGGGLIAAHGASSAANAQVGAANQAARLSAAEGQNALDFQKGQYANSQAELAPIYNTGINSLQQLQYLLGVPSATPNGPGGYTAGSATASVPADPSAQYGGKSFNELVNSGDPNVSPNKETTAAWQQAGTPFHNITTSDGRQVAVRDTTASAPPTPQASGFNIPTAGSFTPNKDLGGFGSLATPFQAPSLDTTTDPGYLARLALGQKAIENSAAARGGLLSSGTGKALDNYTQDYASNEYDKVYGRSFNTFETNQANTFNRLAELAGFGPGAASTSANAGQSAAGNVTNIDLGTGANVGSNINAAGSARATGYANTGNIIGNSLNGLGSNLGLLYLLGGKGGGGDSLFGGGFAPSSVDPSFGAPPGWG